MKRYQPYRHIRKSASILGLGLAHFSLFMAMVIFSFLVLIFSFRLWLFVLLFMGNTMTYLGLLLSNEIFALLKQYHQRDRLITGKLYQGYGLEE